MELTVSVKILSSGGKPLSLYPLLSYSFQKPPIYTSGGYPSSGMDSLHHYLTIVKRLLTREAPFGEVISQQKTPISLGKTSQKLYNGIL